MVETNASATATIYRKFVYTILPRIVIAK